MRPDDDDCVDAGSARPLPASRKGTYAIAFWKFAPALVQFTAFHQAVT